MGTKNDPIRKAKWAGAGVMAFGGLLLWMEAGMALYAFGAGLLLSGAGMALVALAAALQRGEAPTQEPEPAKPRRGERAKALREELEGFAAGAAPKAREPERSAPMRSAERFDPSRIRTAKIAFGLGMALLGVGLAAHLGALMLALFG